MEVIRYLNYTHVDGRTYAVSQSFGLLSDGTYQQRYKHKLSTALTLQSPDRHARGGLFDKVKLDPLQTKTR
jgi:predicted heme/steroid binding protein